MAHANSPYGTPADWYADTAVSIAFKQRDASNQAKICDIKLREAYKHVATLANVSQRVDCPHAQAVEEDARVVAGLLRELKEVSTEAAERQLENEEIQAEIARVRAEIVKKKMEIERYVKMKYKEISEAVLKNQMVMSKSSKDIKRSEGFQKRAYKNKRHMSSLNLFST
uniref:Uncharacterized protein n=1 Tax=Euplotes harpa TaxID=151035 RepID=A0A7S3JL73_9SPIT|mmetsp:Transcript_6725/g.7662  ORF Transcript_6725/g.7662 Transcript_6725/m.7662 type:complete len:169 (+) Transcript_6725:24-530(+)